MIRLWRFLLFWPTLPVWAPFALLMRADKRLVKPELRFLVWVPWGVTFFVLDVLYNWIFGTLAWGFPPRRITYSQRLEDEWHKGSIGAETQARILNKLDPGHIKPPPEPSP